jgi:hypothetical protein
MKPHAGTPWDSMDWGNSDPLNLLVPRELIDNGTFAEGDIVTFGSIESPVRAEISRGLTDVIPPAMRFRIVQERNV